jgi:hypothetical protein
VDWPIRVFQEPAENDERNSEPWWSKILSVIYGGQDNWVDLHQRKKVPSFYSGKPTDSAALTADGITLVAGVVFGAIHCIAWSFDFRSHTELFLWRLSSITAVPTSFGLPLLSAPLNTKYDGENRNFVRFILLLPLILLLNISFFLMPFLGLLYILARLTTIVNQHSLVWNGLIHPRPACIYQPVFASTWCIPGCSLDNPHSPFVELMYGPFHFFLHVQ